MILEFSIENYRSFRDKQTFSMIPDEAKKEFLENIYTVSDKYKVLKSAVIYGANASGKSNFMKALQAFWRLVVNSGNYSPNMRLRQYDPYKLNYNKVYGYSKFFLDFVINDIRYTYSIQLHLHYIVAEELYFYPEGTKAKLFCRSENEYSFGEYLKGQKSIVKEITTRNQLYLSKGASSNIDILKNIYLHIFHNFMPIPFLTTRWDSRYSKRIAELLYDKNKNDLFIKNFKLLLKTFDTGITDFVVKKNKVDIYSFEDNYKIFVEHQVVKFGNGKRKKILFPIEEESTGTQKLFVLGGLVLRALIYGRTIMIDEFERSLHPNISNYLIQLFHNSKINTKGAQLIIATHDTNLLNDNDLRRDQIWIVEKDQQGASELFSLADMTGIPKDVPYEKWYLSGRFGGIPTIKSLDFTLNFKHEAEETQITSN